MTAYRLAARCARMDEHTHPPSPPGAIRLSGGSAFVPTMPHVVREAMAAAEEYRAETMQYGPLMGLADLRAQLAAHERRLGTACTPENILVTNGAKQGIDLICRAFLDPGDAVIVSAPTYVTAVPIFISNDAGFVSIRQDQDGLCVDELEQALAAMTRRGAAVPKLLYDIPDFHNPAGLTLSLERRHRLLALAERYGFLIVEDHTYRQIRFEGEALPALSALDDGTHVLVVNTLSKLLAPGMRIGWVVAPPSLLSRLAALKADGGTSPFLQRIAALVFARDGIAEHVAEVTPELLRHRDAMLSGFAHLLPEVRVTTPQGGYFIWAQLPGSMNGDELAAVALDHGVVVYPGSSCFAADPQRNCLRLSYSQASVGEIEEGMQRLAGAYRELARP